VRPVSKASRAACTTWKGNAAHHLIRQFIINRY
jgi:hypothetical protein